MAADRARAAVAAIKRGEPIPEEKGGEDTKPGLIHPEFEEEDSPEKISKKEDKLPKEPTFHHMFGLEVDEIKEENEDDSSVNKDE